MGEKIKILFVRPFKSSFVQTDLKLLTKHFDVKVVDFILTRKDIKMTFFTPIKMILGVLWADVIFSWFAGSHAFWAVRLSKILKKKSVVVVGGYEVAKVPEIEYGALLNLRSARIVKYILDNADKVLAVSDFNKKEILNNSHSENVELLYNGVDCNKFVKASEKEDLVMTAGNPVKSTCKLKGINTFVKASLAFPKIRFVVIGKYDEHIRQKLNQIAPNVEFTGAIPHEEVVILLQKGKVYCQLSYRESFGMALAESMCCECVPVVTNNAALPEVVGDTGFYVPYGDSEATSNAIKKALRSYKGVESRKRIIEKFSIEKREIKVVEIIYTLLHESKGT